MFFKINSNVKPACHWDLAEPLSKNKESWLNLLWTKEYKTTKLTKLIYIFCLNRLLMMLPTSFFCVGAIILRGCWHIVKLKKLAHKSRRMLWLWTDFLLFRISSSPNKLNCHIWEKSSNQMPSAPSLAANSSAAVVKLQPTGKKKKCTICFLWPRPLIPT